MTTKLKSPIDPDRYIGTVTQVAAQTVSANLPKATANPERRGQAMGAVGDFVFVDCERYKILGRIVETRIPDRERLTVEPSLGEPSATNPIGRISLLAAVEQGKAKIARGLPMFPRIGDGVYLADAETLGELIRNAVASEGEVTVRLGTIDAGSDVEISLPPEKLFGRHCGVVGATGGGKSWTVATLIAELKTSGGKGVVFDPTGEFADVADFDARFAFEADGKSTQVHFPYQEMTEDDLFSLFRPSGQSQGPKLRDAMKSLKLVHALQGKTAPSGLGVLDGAITKADHSRAVFFSAIGEHAQSVQSAKCTFDITKLTVQIANECIHATGFKSVGVFGAEDKNAASYCEPLISRVSTMLNSAELSCIFGGRGKSLAEVLHDFATDDTKSLALISFRDVRFEHSTREILLNIIGRYMLGLAREGLFRDKPLVVFLDEAHQFLGRTIGDEYGSVRLDSFGLIAKEGRKYGLVCVLATQRPRDIPADVLSQLGTLIVHRLTNDQDRETIEKACGELDRGAAQFIPVLAPGEAIVIGPDLPAPLPLLIRRPPKPPNSAGPPFQKYWNWRRTEMQKELDDARFDEGERREEDADGNGLW